MAVLLNILENSSMVKKLGEHTTFIFWKFLVHIKILNILRTPTAKNNLLNHFFLPMFPKLILQETILFIYLFFA